jgi:hypothetical protein
MDTEIYDEFDGGPEGNGWGTGDNAILPVGDDGDGNQGGDSPNESSDESGNEWMKEVNTLKNVKGPRITDYEQQRQANILRNEQMLAELGNDWDDFEKRMRKGKVQKLKKTRAPRNRPAKGTKATRRSGRKSGPEPGPSPPSDPSVLAPAAHPPLPLRSPQASPSATLAVATGSLISDTTPTSPSIPTWLENVLAELKAVEGPPGWTELADALWLLDLSLGYPTGKVCSSVFFLHLHNLISCTHRERPTLLAARNGLPLLANGSSMHALHPQSPKSTTSTLGYRCGKHGGLAYSRRVARG